MISLLMEHLIGLTDTAYLGRVGEVELGASALAGVYYLVIFMLGFGFSVGAQVLMARRNGEGEYRKIGEVFMQGSAFLLLFAALLFTLSHVYSPVILRPMIDSDAVYHATLEYIDWRVYGFFFSFIGAMFRAFFVGITNTKTLTANSLVMVGTNIVLNYILIFGKCGFPALGIAGAAMASSISEAVSVLFYIIYTYRRINYKKYGLFVFSKIDFLMLKQILSVSIWIMMQNGLTFVSWFIFFVAIEHHGERALAITNVVRSVSAFLFLFINAFASTNCSLTSNLIGAGKSEEVLPLCKRIVLLCYTIIIPVGLLIALFPSLILRIYTDNPELIAASIPSLWVMLSSHLIAAPAFICFFCVSGTGNTQVAFQFELLSVFVYTLYTIYIVYYVYADVAVCWTTEHVYDTMVLLSLIYLRSGRWKLKKIQL